MKIGVLAVQGAFIEHEQMLQKLGIPCIELRNKYDLKDIDGLILPGGESTVQGQLLDKLDMKQSLHDMISNGMPVLGTCAGLILLAEHIGESQACHLGTLPVTVKRNAYGRQLSSFMTTSDLEPINIDNYPMVFIRAPYVTDIIKGNDNASPLSCKSSDSSDVTVLATVDDHIVAVQYQNQIGLSFHPEMTEDPRIHQYFIELVKSVVK